MEKVLPLARRAVYWLLDQLDVKRNAPRWGTLATAAIIGWIAENDIDLSFLDGPLSMVGLNTNLAIGLLVTLAIGTAIQKLATFSRFPALDRKDEALPRGGPVDLDPAAPAPNAPDVPPLEPDFDNPPGGIAP